MKCREARRLIGAYWDDELTQAEREWHGRPFHRVRAMPRVVRIARSLARAGQRAAPHRTGHVHNMKFSRQMFTKERPRLEALLKTYFAKGGTQAMITVVSRGDLENALKEPEQYRNLIVRVWGWSGYFCELSPEYQDHILKRHMYPLL